MKMLLGLFMASLLLLAGCPQDDTGGGTIPQGTPNGGGTAPQGEAPPQEVPPEPEPVELVPDEFENWDMEVLMALGQPVHCTTTYADASISTESEVFFKGESMRVESVSIMEGETFTTRMIIIGNLSYISMDGQTYGLEEDCDWIKMDFERLQECIPEEMQEDAIGSDDLFNMEQDFENTPDDFNCEYALFGDEKFVPQGKVCDLTEEMCELYEMLGSGGALSNMPIDESLCEDLTGTEYEQCMEAVASYGD
jgi:hypothetical protein